MNKQTVGAGVIALIIGMGIGYMGAGMFSRPTTPSGQFARGSFSGSPSGQPSSTRGNSQNGGMLSGTVVSVSSSSLTLNTRDGSSHIVLVTPETTVSKSVSGALADIASGAAVIVSGTTNSDGSVSASMIQLRSAMPATPQAE